jgi:hypothetical protein
VPSVCQRSLAIKRRFPPESPLSRSFQQKEKCHEPVEPVADLLPAGAC